MNTFVALTRITALGLVLPASRVTLATFAKPLALSLTHTTHPARSPKCQSKQDRSAAHCD
jgi:hypothetical protein